MKHKALITAILLSLSSPTLADTNLTLAYGIGTNVSRSDGNWHQDALPTLQKIDRTDRVWSIGLNGSTGISWLRWEAVYIDRGETRVDGVFVSDEDYVRRDFSGNKDHVFVRDRNQGIALTFNPAYQFNNKFSVSTGLGIYVFRDSINSWVIDNATGFLKRCTCEQDSTGQALYYSVKFQYSRFYLKLDGDNGGYNSSGIGAANRSTVIGIDIPL